MKQNHSSKRHRGRSNGRRGSHGAGHSIESNGPDVKIRGKASQLFEKYQSLSHDALSLGDRVASESYLQHAEHYYRVMAAQNGDNSNDGRSKSGRERDDKASSTSGSSEAGASATGSSEVAEGLTRDNSSDGTSVRGGETGEGASATA